jgi:hypothetical protein
VDDKKIKYKITGTFHPHINESQKKFVDSVETIYNSTAHVLNEYKSILGLYDFTVDKFRHYVSNPVKNVDTDLSAGSYMTMNLLEGTSEYRSLFTDLDDNEISWDILENTYFRFIPIIRFKCVNITHGRVTIKIELIKAVITHITTRNRMYDQSNTIRNLKLKNPDLSTKLTHNLRVIANAKKSDSSTATPSNMAQMIPILPPPPSSPNMEQIIPIQIPIPVNNLIPVNIFS